MIRNERQHRITRAQARRFERALETLEEGASSADGVHPRLRQAECDAIAGQLADLRRELSEYEALRSGRRLGAAPETLDELPMALIRARIAAGLTQKQLAENLGLKEQQIQHYEATDYAGASLDRVQRIARTLGVRMRPPSPETAAR